MAAAVAVGLKMIGPAIPTKALIPLLTNLLRLLQAMAQIHMLNVSPFILTLRLMTLALLALTDQTR